MTASPIARRSLTLAAVAAWTFAGCASASETQPWQVAEMQWPGAAKVLETGSGLGFRDKAKTKGPAAPIPAEIVETGLSFR